MNTHFGRFSNLSLIIDLAQWLKLWAGNLHNHSLGFYRIICKSGLMALKLSYFLLSLGNIVRLSSFAMLLMCLNPVQAFGCF